MTYYRRFTCEDLLKFNSINMDPHTEYYDMSCYLDYLARWPDFFIAAEHPSGDMMGYIMGKVEGQHKENKHGHVSALSVSTEFRRIGVASGLMERFEQVSERKDAFFIDLFVRVYNQAAVSLYMRLGYVVYRTVLDYYCTCPIRGSEEDAYDMRKPLSPDVECKSLITENDYIMSDEISF